jgi:hypothetical protein
VNVFPKSDTTKTVRTVKIGVDGLRIDRIVHGSRVDLDFVLDEVIVTLMADPRDARLSDLNVTATGRYAKDGAQAERNFGSSLRDAEPVLLLALHQGLPASFSHLIAEAQR